jgi:hypothetical protein
MYVPIQTKSLWSTKMPCGFRGQLDVSSIGPWPHPWTTLPCASNSITGGAATQQVPIGGCCCAEVSSSVSVSGRCVTQTCCFESTNTPVTAPRIHLFGISSGHDGSTVKAGGFVPDDCARVEDCRRLIAIAKQTTTDTRAR